MKKAKFNPATADLHDLGRLDYIDETRASMVYRPDSFELENCTIISSTGRELVERYPNVDEDLIKRLYTTDSIYLSKKEREFVTTASIEEIIEEVFVSHDAIGIAHLSLCIRSNLYQPMAELMESFANDKKISFLLSAIYITAYTKRHKLCYYTYSPDRGYDVVEWIPTGSYIPPSNTFPPVLKYKKDSPYKSSEASTIPISNCPACGSDSSTLRCGRNLSKWQVCCNNEDCKYYTGYHVAATEDEAIQLWNVFAEEEGMKRAKRKAKKAKR